MIAVNEAVERLQSRWQGLSLREQILAGLGGIVLIFALVVNGLINPLVTRQQQAQQQLDNSRRLYAEVVAGAEKIQRLQARGGSVALSELGHPVDERVRRAAQGNSIAIHRITMQQNNMQIQLGEVPFVALTRWLTDLEQQGIRLGAIQINQTGKPGIVTVDQLRLAEGGRS